MSEAATVGSTISGSAANNALTAQLSSLHKKKIQSDLRFYPHSIYCDKETVKTVHNNKLGLARNFTRSDEMSTFYKTQPFIPSEPTSLGHFFGSAILNIPR